MLVSMKEMLCKARREGYGVMAPSIDSEGCMRVAIEAAEELHAPIILNLNPKQAFMMEDYDFYAQIACRRAERASVPVAVNLDHGHTYQEVMQAIHAGFSSVMLDASTLSFEDNIEAVREVVKVAHACGVSVEAELGCVGLADAENEAMKLLEGLMAKETVLTDPTLAREYVDRTGVDCLAVSIGNKHGTYKGVPHIEFDLLERIAAATDIPLVLHGGSGTGDENLAKACSMGICKINVGSEVRSGAAKALLNADEKIACFKPFQLLLEGYKERVRYHIGLFGSAGKA